MYEDLEGTHAAKAVGVTATDADGPGEPAAPDVPFIAKPTRVEFGGADEDPTEWGFVAGQGDAPADITQQDAYQDPQEYGSGYLTPPQQPPSALWRHVPSSTDTASPSGMQPPETPDEG